MCTFADRMARILAIDYGEKRTGLAVTDPLQLIVTSLETVDTNLLMDYLKNYLSFEMVEKIVLGLPLHADGTPNRIEEKIGLFIEKLKNAFPGIAIDRQEEFGTSEEARRVIFQSGRPKKKRREKGLVDRVSAVLILQKYLGHI